MTLTPDDLQRYITEHAICAELIRDLGETPTVPAAAAALGVGTDQIIKTLLFLVERGDGAPQPVVVISHGTRRVDKGQLALWCGVGKKRVTLAPAQAVLDLLGYPAGGVPPFGHCGASGRAAATVLDASVMRLEEHSGGVIFGGGGDDRTMLRLTVEELRRVVQPEVVAVSAET